MNNTTIEQLWWTWSQEGRGVTTGYRIRASSRGLTSIDDTLKSHLSYYLPQGADASSLAATPEKAPVSLAFTNTSQGHILVNKVFTGKDLIGRPSAFFSHLITSFPDNFSAYEAIKLWMSPFWKSSDRDIDPATREIPTTSLSHIPISNLAQAHITRAQEFLPFVIQAFLQLETQQKLYIMASSEIVAALIWGLTSCLPPALLKGLTFSTYEARVNEAPQRIIGTDRGTPQQDLPVSCYGGNSLAINCYTGRSSQLINNPVNGIFSEFVTQQLIGGNSKLLEDLRSMAIRLNVTSLDKYLLLYKFLVAQNLSKGDIELLLSTPELATELLVHENVQNIFISLLKTDPIWWRDSIKAKLDNLRKFAGQPSQVQLGQTLSAFAMYIARVAQSTVEAGDVSSFELLLVVIASLVPPTVDSSVWIYLHQTLTREPVINAIVGYPRVHRRLLEHWGAVQQPLAIEYMQPWLKISWGDLEAFLMTRAPAEWHRFAMKYLLDTTPGVLPQEIMGIIERHAKDFEEIVKSETQHSQRQEAINNFAKLVQSGFRGKVRLAEILLVSNLEDDHFLETLFSLAGLSSTELLRIVEQYPQLLYQQVMPRSIVDFVRHYLAQLNADDLDRVISRRLVKHTMQSKSLLTTLPEGLQTQINHWDKVMDFYQQPILGQEQLIGLGHALEGLPPKSLAKVKEKILRVLVQSVRNYDNLVAILSTMIPIMAPSKVDLLYYLIRTELSLGRGISAVSFYIYAVIEEAKQLPPEEKRNYIDYLCSILVKGANRETYDQLDRMSEKWGEEIKHEWITYSHTNRPLTPIERAQRAQQGIQHKMAYDKAKRALATKKVMLIGKAYDPVLEDYEKITSVELIRLTLAYHFKVAYEKNSDSGLIKAYKAIEENGQQTFFLLTEEETDRIKLAYARPPALSEFRQALASGDVSLIVATYKPVLDEYKKVTAAERQQLALAKRMVQALSTDNDQLLAEVGREIQTSPYRTIFKFKPVELQRINQALEKSTSNSASQSQVTLSSPVQDRYQVAQSQPSPLILRPPDKIQSVPSPSPSQSNLKIIVNQEHITNSWFDIVCKLKVPFVHYTIEQMGKQPSQPKDQIKELQAEISVERLNGVVLLALIEDVMIQEGIKDNSNENTKRDIEQEVNRYFDQFHRYLGQVWSALLNTIQDDEIRSFIRIEVRRRYFSKYLEGQGEQVLKNWLEEHSRNVTIIDPASGHSGEGHQYLKTLRKRGKT